MKTKLLFKVILICFFILNLSYVEETTSFFNLYVQFLPLSIVCLSTFLKDAFTDFKAEVDIAAKVWLILIYGTIAGSTPTFFVSAKVFLIDMLGLAYLQTVQVVLFASVIVYAVSLALKKLKYGKIFIEKK